MTASTQLTSILPLLVLAKISFKRTEHLFLQKDHRQILNVLSAKTEDLSSKRPEHLSSQQVCRHILNVLSKGLKTCRLPRTANLSSQHGWRWILNVFSRGPTTSPHIWTAMFMRSRSPRRLLVSCLCGRRCCLVLRL